MSERAALYLGQVDLVADQALNPILVVLEGQIQDKAARVGQLLLELVVDQV